MLHFLKYSVSHALLYHSNPWQTGNGQANRWKGEEDNEDISPLSSERKNGDQHVFLGQTEKTNEFLESYRRTAKSNKWSYETKLLQLPCSLRGDALDWFEAVEAVDMDFGKVNQLKNISTKTSHEEQLHYQLTTRTQQKEEDVWKYNREVLRRCKVSGDDRAGNDPFCSEGTTGEDTGNGKYSGQ
ncbi:hypothetical protein Trydic_g13651 [Trypoxylus dichotomus]